MKTRFLFFLALGLTLGGCEPEQDTLFGTWTVDKVNVQFDESRTTPELVKQVGEMERGNTLSISAITQGICLSRMAQIISSPSASVHMMLGVAQL